MKKKIIITIIILIGIAGLVVGAIITLKNIPVKDVKINISYLSDDKMLWADDVHNALIYHFGELKGVKCKAINTKEIQQYLNKINFIYSCEVELGILGTLTINIQQKIPIAKIITVSKKQVYLSNDASLLQTIPSVSADVMIINGYISIAKAAKDTTNNKILSDVYLLAHKVYHDTLLNKQIAQIYVNKDKTFDLFPLEGNYTIKFGGIDSLDSKIKRLVIFYEKGEVTNEDWKNIYQINLSINNQVVCSKKDKVLL
ncbi:MAG: hypothetical protein LBR17_08795 [Bacteroidales bacterium]|jgi:cell division protein FtsQ|nr:hypothetical protein [Bacteroidales bacterium]